MDDVKKRLLVASRRSWRAYAALRRTIDNGFGHDPSRAWARPKGASMHAWHEHSAARHDRYRSDIEPAAASASVMCVTNRPHLIGQVVANVVRQKDVDVELIVVPTSAGFDRADIEAQLAPVERSVVLWQPHETSLGAGLNLALDATAERFVAKFDDDDHYGPHFLADSLRAHACSNSGVVGKHSYYADVTELDARYVRFPGHEFTYGSTLAGGTLVIDRDRTGDLRFPDLSLGEDGEFIAACHRRGISTFAGDRFNFVQHRGADNTWRVSANEFIQCSERVDANAPEHQVDR